MTTRPTKPPRVNGRRPRSVALPGLDDRAIAPLDDVARDYADIRDQRMVLASRERVLKARTVALMKKLGRQSYRRDGIAIELLERDDVKVRVRKPVTDGDERRRAAASTTDDAAAPDGVTS